MIENKKAVIFDLFDTLTDHESNWSEVPRASKMLGLDSIEWNRQLLFNSEDRLTGKMNDPFQILKTLAHNIDDTISDDLIHQVVFHRTQRYKDALKNIPVENIETIVKLRQQNKKIALLSNADVMEKSGWESSPLHDLFDVVLFSCDAGFAKPDAEFYSICLKKLGLLPSECIFVGDGGSNELNGAKNLGISTVFISGKMKRKQPEEVFNRMQTADFHIEEIPQLLEL